MMNTKAVDTDRAIGAVWGLALADAYGDPLEFRKYSSLLASYPNGPEAPKRFRVTDDTQMSLAVWTSLNAWDGRSMGTLRSELMVDFLAWEIDPDNDRAPGNTCLSSLAKLRKQGLGSWSTATSAASAGCGSVMRAPWVGLHPKVTDDTLDAVAMTQAVLTHGPSENAYCAAAVAGLTRALARGEVVPGGCSAWLDEWVAARVGSAYDEAALGDLYRHARRTDDRGNGQPVVSREEYVAEGLRHVSWVANAAELLSDALYLDHAGWRFDPCSVAGEGWRARECMAVAVGIVDGVVDPVEAVRRAAMTGGDSDSIAAVTGALLGAAYGDVWPAEWKALVEPRYRMELAAVTRDLG